LTITIARIGFIQTSNKEAVMGEVISIPAVLFILFIVISLVTIFIVSAWKKHKLQLQHEKNVKGLPAETTQLFQSCTYQDARWVEEFGTTLDAQDLEDPLEVAVDAGWRAMDRAKEVLTQGDFASDTTLLPRFIEFLNEAEMHFDIADRLMKEFAKEVEG
jgi:hypothetical protein